MLSDVRKKGTNNVLFIAIFMLLLVISFLSLFLSSKCINKSPLSLHEDQRTRLVVRNRCMNSSEEEKEEYFKARFKQEIQNLVNNNVTEYVKQIKVIQQLIMDEQLAIQRRTMEDHFAKTISSMEQIYKVPQNADSNLNSCETKNDTVLFPSDLVGKYVVAMARVPRESFKSTFSPQFGGPFLDSYPGVKDLMLIYGSPDTRPNNFSAIYGITTSATDDNNNRMNTIPLIDDMRQATENCDQLHVVFTSSETKDRRQCIALVPNHESYHVHVLARPSNFTDNEKSGVNVYRNEPYQMVSRYHRVNPPALMYQTPRFEEDTKPFFEYLRIYLSVVDTVLNELRIILSKIALNNQVVVMLCNHGQSVLLSNFICAAKARNLELSNVIVFTTDQETTDLVTSFGLTAYYDQGVRICICPLGLVGCTLFTYHKTILTMLYCTLNHLLFRDLVIIRPKQQNILQTRRL
jgi:hypothetical protein